MTIDLYLRELLKKKNTSIHQKSIIRHITKCVIPKWHGTHFVNTETDIQVIFFDRRKIKKLIKNHYYVKLDNIASVIRANNTSYYNIDHTRLSSNETIVIRSFGMKKNFCYGLKRNYRLSGYIFFLSKSDQLKWILKN